MVDGRPMISVVLSFKNEAENIPELVSRLAAMFDTQAVDYELLFVNDASTDGSLEVLLRERAANERVKIINTSRSFGVSECVRAGLAHASGDAAVYLDADLQDPPEVIPRMLEAWRHGADVVHTVRTRRLHENAAKMWLTGVAYRLIHFGATVNLPVDAGDFKLLSRRAIDHVLALREADPYLRGLVVWIGFTQVCVEYERVARHSGVTHFPFLSRNPWKTFVLGMTSFSFTPVYACAALAALGLVLVTVLVAAAGVMAVTGGSVATILLIALLTFFWATLLGAVSIVGLYVIRAYKDVRGRPQYIIASTVGVTRSSTSSDAASGTP
jgi:dolichol-phosphate mannosyltransferase